MSVKKEIIKFVAEQLVGPNLQEFGRAMGKKIGEALGSKYGERIKPPKEEKKEDTATEDKSG